MATEKELFEKNIEGIKRGNEFQMTKEIEKLLLNMRNLILLINVYKQSSSNSHQVFTDYYLVSADKLKAKLKTPDEQKKSVMGTIRSIATNSDAEQESNEKYLFEVKTFLQEAQKNAFDFHINRIHEILGLNQLQQQKLKLNPSLLLEIVESLEEKGVLEDVVTTPLPLAQERIGTSFKSNKANIDFVLRIFNQHNVTNPKSQKLHEHVDSAFNEVVSRSEKANKRALNAVNEIATTRVAHKTLQAVRVEQAPLPERKSSLSNGSRKRLQ